MPPSCRTPRIAAAVLAFALVPLTQHATAAIFRVGPGCQYPDLDVALAASALDDAAELRLSGGGAFAAPTQRIEFRHVTIAGGYPDCSSDIPAGTSLVSGLGGSHTSVFSIRNDAVVTLRQLTIAFGDDTDGDDNGGSGGGHGGGVDFRGSGRLELIGTIVLQNEADYGGGINVAGSGSGATLVIGPGTRISNNTAQASGGGIRIEGNTRLQMLANDTGIVGNLAQAGYGGGIEVIGPARADIGSPGYALGGVQRAAISDNQADYGGGIAAISLEHEAAIVRLFTTDARHPVRLQGNRAYQTGGAVYLNPHTGFQQAFLCAYDFRLDGNFAQEGSAIYADTESFLGTDYGAQVLLNRFDRCSAGELAALGAVRCTAGPECNSIEGNKAENAAHVPTPGAAVLIQTEGTLDADRVRWRGNRGAHALRNVEGALLRVSTCEFSGNTASQALIRSTGGAVVQLRACTVAHNAIGGASAISTDGGVELLQSVLYEPSGIALVAGGGARNVIDVLASERATLDGGATPFVFVADPRFMDSAYGDFRLQAASPGVDAASVATAAGVDLDGRPRGRDLPVVDDHFGPTDLGAYERQSVGNLVLNPEFPDRADAVPDHFRSWQTVVADRASWVVEGAGGGTGSVYVTHTPDITPGGRAKGAVASYAGLRQCIPLPGPARYSLNAHSRVPGTIAVNRDYARVHWILRSDDAGCAGAPGTEGNHYLPRSASWSTGAAATITLPRGEWTANSTLEIALEVLDGDQVGNNEINAYFDAVRLEVLDLEVPDVFSDGFEG